MLPDESDITTRLQAEFVQDFGVVYRFTSFWTASSKVTEAPLSFSADVPTSAEFEQKNKTI